MSLLKLVHCSEIQRPWIVNNVPSISFSDRITGLTGFGCYPVNPVIPSKIIFISTIYI